MAERDPFSWAEDFARTQNAFAAKDRATAEAYRQAVLDAQLGDQKALRDDKLQRGRMKYGSDLEMDQYVEKQPYEREQRRYNQGLETEAYEDRLAMRGQLVNPRDVNAEDLIAGFEDFREKPYWDVNHHRVGYGSDTVTDADGRVSRTTPNSRVSEEDARRDLSRRVGEFQSAAIQKLGQDTWDSLPNNAKAAVTSIAYNYGEIPDRIVKPAQSGNLDALASAVEQLGADNRGVNRSRRLKEANLIRQRGQAQAAGAVNPNSVVGVSPEVNEYFTRQGLKPIREVKMSAGQIELLPPEMKTQFVPNPFGKPDRYGNVPYVMVDTAAKIAGGPGDLDLSDLDEQ